MRLPPTAALCAALFSPISQDNERPLTESQQIRLELGRLRRTRQTEAERVSAMESLLGLGANGPWALASVMERECSKLRKAFLKEEKQFFKDFFATARQQARKQIGMEEEVQLQKARDVLLRNARNLGLTKEQIKKESDPALAVLEKLLRITQDQVLEQNPKLRKRHDTLVEGLEQEIDRFQWWTSSRDALAGLDDSQKYLRRLKAPVNPTADLTDFLDHVEHLAVFAIPMNDQDLAVLEANHALAEQIDREEFSGIFRLNMMRVRIGMNPLKIDVKLCTASRDHCKDMHTLKFFSHTSPVKGKESPVQRAKLAGTSGGGGKHRSGLANRTGRHSPMVVQPGASSQHAR